MEPMERLSGNAGIKIFPNPASNRATLSFSPPKSGQVSAALYDITGKYVLSIFKGYAEKNILRQVEISTANLSAGTYIVRLQMQEKIQQQKLVLIR
jgi:hypothetical protein